jgi:6-phosphogluconolactonase/glucosamine-6-phosphate isomerase/deaminase
MSYTYRMNIHVTKSYSLTSEAGQALNTVLAAYRNKNFLFLSSGGSSLALLEHLDPENFGPWSTVCVLDERYSADPAVNNFAQLAQTAFYTKILKNGALFIDTRPLKEELMENTALRFQAALETWKQKSGGAIIATVGIGPDAHTSGIMPYPEDKKLFDSLFNDAQRLVVGYDAGAKNPHPLRITVTIPFLKAIDFALTFVKGEDKKSALQKLTAETGATHESPCRILRELPRVEVFTDIIVP